SLISLRPRTIRESLAHDHVGTDGTVAKRLIGHPDGYEQWVRAVRVGRHCSVNIPVGAMCVVVGLSGIRCAEPCDGDTTGIAGYKRGIRAVGHTMANARRRAPRRSPIARD